MVTNPADTPVTSPVEASTVALAVLRLFQIPPGAPPVLVIEIDAPTQTDDGPLTVPAEGTAFTVTV